MGTAVESNLHTQPRRAEGPAEVRAQLLLANQTRPGWWASPHYSAGYAAGVVLLFGLGTQ